MRTIWKFSLDIANVQTITIPKNHRYLHVGEQDEKPAIWAEVDSLDNTVTKTIYIFGTGHNMDGRNRELLVPTNGYIGTAQMKNGLVWHIYEGY